MIAPNEQIAGQSQDFACFVELQQKYTEASNKLEALEVAINVGAQSAAMTSAADYVVLQETVAALEADLKALFALHPEWRGDKKSVATPYGTVEQRSATKLEVPNIAATVAKIEKMFGDGAVEFLHITKEPNLEFLERFDDAQLAEIGIKRVTTESVTVKPAKVNVAKAVKAAKQPKQK